MIKLDSRLKRRRGTDPSCRRPLLWDGWSPEVVKKHYDKDPEEGVVQAVHTEEEMNDGRRDVVEPHEVE